MKLKTILLISLGLDPNPKPPKIDRTPKQPLFQDFMHHCLIMRKGGK